MKVETPGRRSPAQHGEAEKTLLVLVEDNRADADLLSLALTDCCAPDVTVLSDGQQAIDFVLNADTRDRMLFVVDLNLPLRTGFEVLEALKHNATSTHRTEALVLSSSAWDRDRERALALGAAAFISKPRDLDGFDTVARQLCRRLAEL